MSMSLSNQSSDYLATEVMTASPAKLRLMLIEAAIRFAERGRHAWRLQQWDQATEAIIRCQEIMAEILGGMTDRSNELVRRLAAIYTFVYRTFIVALAERSEAKLDEAISVLEIERETWRQLCEKLAAETPASTDAGEYKPAATPHVPAPHIMQATDDAPIAGGFMVEG